MTPLLNEFKPRKTKYGFNTNLYSHNFLEVAALISSTIGQPDPDLESAWYLEVQAGYASGVELKIYVNDITVYNTLKSSPLVKGLEPKVKK
jgi:hypothetical protein